MENRLQEAYQRSFWGITPWLVIFIVSGVLTLSFVPLFNQSTAGQEQGSSVKTRIRPPSSHATLGSSACERCHKSQNEWWPENAHYKTAQPFLEQDRKRAKIARLYGANPTDMAKGTQVCMDCHGTIVTGRESEEVLDGVGCEACHGPAQDYLKPHQAGEPSLGDKRPGYLKGLELGLVKLRDVKVRARTCTGCHVITESRLISAGHPTGETFDFVDGVSYIRHWTAPVEPADALQSAYRLVLGERGRSSETVALPRKTEAPPPPPAAVPEPALLASPAPPEKLSPIQETVPQKGTPPVQAPAPAPMPAPSSRSMKPVAPSPSQPPSAGSPQPVESAPMAPPALEVSPSPPPRPLPKANAPASIEEVLLTIKERLESLERGVYSENNENR